MMLFGTIGTISRFVDLPSAFMSCARAFISTLIIVIYIFAGGRRPDFQAIRANAVRLFFAGIFMSLNWVLMFEAFRLTTVAVASLCYYMQPVFLMLSSPVFFKERLNTRKVLCIITAFLGMALVTGVLSLPGTGGSAGAAAMTDAAKNSAAAAGAAAAAPVMTAHIKGALLAVMAAVLYTANVIVSKKFKGDINPIDSTCSQIFVAGVILLPYLWMIGSASSLTFDARSVILLLILSVVHTGIAYIMFYSSVTRLGAQTIAVLGYIDPVESVLLSAFVLREPLTAGMIVGALMILSSTYIGSRD